jgi:hypothetical protein
MNWKLFLTLVGAAVASFLIIHWLLRRERKTAATIPVNQGLGEIGFAAIARQREQFRPQAA